MYLSIDTGAAAKYSKTLQKIGKQALPNAVRNALNSAAFDVKTGTMPAAAASTFEKRQPNFFKANSRVEKATGNNLAAMKAIVGFKSLGGTNHAVDDLEEQEHGGSIGGRSFIPTKQARTGNSWKRNVKAPNRISAIRNRIVDSKDTNGASEKEQFTRSAIYAGKGGIVLGNRRNDAGNKILFSIRSVVRKGKNMVVKSTPLFVVKKGRKVQPAATHFMEKASLQSAKKLEQFYITNAERQIRKYK